MIKCRSLGMRSIVGHGELIYTLCHTATHLLGCVFLILLEFINLVYLLDSCSEAVAASCSRYSRSAWYPSTCLVASSNCSLALRRRFSSFAMRVLMVSMSRRRWGRAGPRFFLGSRLDLDGVPAALGGLGRRSVFAFLAGFSVTTSDGVLSIVGV